MITSVEEHKLFPDGYSRSKRGVGIESAIKMLDDLQNHIGRSHSTVGAQSNTLNMSIERTDVLRISTMSLRSSTVDTDLAESSLRLQQLSLNYQAMLSTVGKISKLSLVYYL
jgi:flagellar hook-associated protein 3 FlgL